MQRDKDYLGPVLTALYGRLTQSTPAAALVGYFTAPVFNQATQQFADGQVAVFQAVPKNFAPPFVVVSSADESWWGSKSCPGAEIKVTLATVSNYAGMMELTNIHGAMIDLLTHKLLDLSATGINHVLLFKEAASNQVNSDGVTRIRRQVIRLNVCDSTQTDPIRA